ncbi:MAG TPA: hypothetical protein VJU15_05495 [Gemmatimonadales bacterium]|nr:hypothetical protein [Gemmatimonadales bacterium]
MSQFAWSEQVTTISSTLRTLEKQVADGERDAPGLADLKSALDDLRLRAWGLLMAANETDYANFQERFRIRRTREMCAALSSDIRSGKFNRRNPELPDVAEAARDVAKAVEEAAR